MELDWFTVGAQILNFLILILLLKRFLYGPILNAMQRRENGIKTQLEEIEQRTREVERAADQYHEKLAHFDQEKERLLAEARDAVDQQRNHWLDQARTEVAQHRRDWQKDLTQEKQHYTAELRSKLALALCSTARRLLADLADAELEQQVIQRFLDKLQNLPHGQLARIRSDCASAANPVRVTTAFPLSKSAKQTLSKGICDRLQSPTAPVFAQRSDMICGIALQTTNVDVEWNMQSYCDELMDLLPGTDEPAVAGSDQPRAETSC